MQVYKDFDIGTDKIPLEKRGNIPHHLLDVVSPSTQFTAADFAQLALETANAVLKKKKLPFIVGGTGLYLKALLNGLSVGREFGLSYLLLIALYQSSVLAGLDIELVND